MQLNVRDINQRASGASYVVIYDADIELDEDHRIDVQVLAAVPPDADPVLIEAARLAILEGASAVLIPLAQGAVIRVQRLIVGPGDFHPKRFARSTAVELRRLLAHASQASSVSVPGS